MNEKDIEIELLAEQLALLSEELESVGMSTELILEPDDAPYLMVMEDYFTKGQEESPISPITIEYEFLDDEHDGDAQLLLRLQLTINMSKGRVATLKKRYLAWNKAENLSRAYFDEENGVLFFEMTTTDYGRVLPPEAVRLMADTLADEVRKL